MSMSIEGVWTTGEPVLRFTFHQKDSHVAGVFHDQKVFTCEFQGTLTGINLAIKWQTIWSWLNVHETGQATLTLSPDGRSLTGNYSSNLASGVWRLTRQAVGPDKAPEPAPGRPFTPPYRTSSLHNSDYDPRWSHHERMVKDVWDAKYDPAKREKLKQDARFNPELEELMIRSNLLPRPPQKKK